MSLKKRVHLPDPKGLALESASLCSTVCLGEKVPMAFWKFQYRLFRGDTGMKTLTISNHEDLRGSRQAHVGLKRKQWLVFPSGKAKRVRSSRRKPVFCFRKQICECNRIATKKKVKIFLEDF